MNSRQTELEDGRSPQAGRATLASHQAPAGLGHAEGIPNAVAAKTLGEWREEDGFVVWWAFPVVEPAWIGTPNCSDWPGYHTHWTSHPSIPESGAVE